MADREPPMTDDERAIWAATYAAAFVSHFRDTHASCRQDRTSPVGARTLVPFDRAMQIMTAEEGITIADAAVRRLRQWRAAEEPGAGVTLGSWPKEWDDDG